MRTGEYGDHFVPIDQKSARLLDKAEHGLLALSMFNSYFSQEVIDFSVAAMHDRFRTFDVVTPGEQMRSLLEAAGYDQQRALAKVRKNLSMLRGRTLRAFDRIGVPRLTAQAHLLTFDDFRGGTPHDEITAVIREKAEHDNVFRDACLNISRRVLRRVDQSRQPTEAELEATIGYYVSEAAVMTNTADMLGHDSSVTCYRHVMEFIAPLYEGKLSWRPSEKQGYASLRRPPS
ncbi:tRNA-dependent cyclodipeptide synthase [Amycolatopsis rubida]|uniref:Cyclodipeptide synthase n=1 Tax=Amycolatopsis rubida TaxID=112413 RepID=A0A1I5ZI41_9PSEU|nr:MULTISPECIES: tRNA-dependent cyclodipeptide synthase [Amycolatopsis]MYW93005.1 tRNA-dependent cyclodipeptide synthase [Amycolatopsis rubida]NEC57992.1 tRNA-dependent cyclodipeptide synthase [Amycolatopsis rubida]OAP25530.1 Cyclo(L-leucyl-L-leucyl) synthase [Amycolatopsis sp. M39]SFQ55807.1 tRNA-dependent cyclodipeptide synthase [Amycolatopsis rubida]